MVNSAQKLTLYLNHEMRSRLTIPGKQLGTLQEYHLQVTKNSYFHTIDKQNIFMTK